MAKWLCHKQNRVIRRMFWLYSKLFWLVFQPVSVILLLVLAGLLLSFRTRKTLGRTLIGLGLALLLLLGFTNTGDLILQSLEARYQRPCSLPRQRRRPDRSRRRHGQRGERGPGPL